MEFKAICVFLLILCIFPCTKCTKEIPFETCGDKSIEILSLKITEDAIYAGETTQFLLGAKAKDIISSGYIEITAKTKLFYFIPYTVLYDKMELCNHLVQK